MLFAFSKICYGIGGTVLKDPERPRGIDFNAQERRTELNLLNDLKEAKRYAALYPKRLEEARQNLADLYAIVVERYRKGK